MTIQYIPPAGDPIPQQTEGTYEDYKKIKGFEDIGYFLAAYVINGGVVTKNITHNNQVDVTDIVVSLNDDLMARTGLTIAFALPSATYYLDFTKDGDWAWGISHPLGSAGVDYLTIATITTDVNGNVDVIADTRGEVGGIRYKTGTVMTGPLRVETTGREISAGTWADMSANSTGYALFAQNCYTSHNNDYRYSNTHASMGARGIRFNHVLQAIEYFDTGAIATTADQIFTPTWVSMKPATAATANTTVLRDGSGRGKVAAPAAADDIARKDTVDNAITYGVQRQALINGGFAVNQRVKTGTVVLTAGQYGHDRWKAGASGCTYTFATSNNVTTVTITTGSLVQVIEGIHLYSGTYTLSWTGTAQGKIGGGSYGTSVITGTIVGGTNTSIEFGTGTLSNVQFNYGSTAVPFQPRSFGEELALCMRYYQKSFSYNVAPIQNVGAGDSAPTALQIVGASTQQYSVFQHYFVVPLRAVPTITTYNPSANNAQVRNYITGTDYTSTIANNATTQRFRVQAISPAGSTASDVVGLHWVADAEL